MTGTLVVYHAGCMDGFTAAWVCWRYGELSQDTFRPSDNATYYAASYPGDNKDTVLPDPTGKDVLMVDFCTSREQLLRIAAVANSLKVLDHHKSRVEECADLPFCEFDMEMSGASLAWRYFRGSAEPPWVVSYVEDRDLWRFALPESKEINAWIGTLEFDFETWSELQAEGRSMAARKGSAVLAHIDRYVRVMAKEARVINFAGHENIPVVNAPYINSSELVGHLAKDATFAVSWFQQADGMIKYSLRSRGDFDVSKFAVQHGGGGHKGAAGFMKIGMPTVIQTDGQEMWIP